MAPTADEVERLRRIERAALAWADALEGQRTTPMYEPEPTWRRAIPRCVYLARQRALLEAVRR